MTTIFLKIEKFPIYDIRASLVEIMPLISPLLAVKGYMAHRSGSIGGAGAPPSAHSVQFFGGMIYALRVAFGVIEPSLSRLD